ncbi:MAG: aminotransferase class IV [Patescibacteria group bacterium]|nr:aminotransferase class IV [Patescibacteria group bacterium]
MNYLYQTPQPDQEIHQHPYLWCNGKIINIENFGFPASTHGFHYGTSIFGGTGVRLCKDGQWRIFRAHDHVQRILDHAQGFGLSVPFSHPEILEAITKICQLNLPSLNRQVADDLYLRMALDPSDQGLGVGSSNKADFIIFSQDLTQYLKIAEGKTGASLLFPGPGLFCRGDKRTSLSFLKSASNYGIGNFWKRIAKQFGAVETLATFDDESNNYSLSETTGACIFLIMKNNTIVTPPLESMCLDSITRRTIIDICHHLGYDVKDNQPLSTNMLWKANCVFLVGTWAGPVFIEEILYDPSYPEVPIEIYTKNNGKEFFQWIINNLNPEPHRYLTSNPAYDFFRQLEKIYWAIVRHDLSLIPAGIEIPESWHTLIP